MAHRGGSLVEMEGPYRVEKFLFPLIKIKTPWSEISISVPRAETKIPNIRNAAMSGILVRRSGWGRRRAE
jgi:hypothetical protein